MKKKRVFFLIQDSGISFLVSSLIPARILMDAEHQQEWFLFLARVFSISIHELQKLLFPYI